MSGKRAKHACISCHSRRGDPVLCAVCALVLTPVCDERRAQGLHRCNLPECHLDGCMVARHERVSRVPDSGFGMNTYFADDTTVSSVSPPDEELVR